MSAPTIMMTALIAALAVACVASLPVWPHSRNWGWKSGAGIALIALIVLALLLNYVV